jgi:hypothetical protein
LLAALIIMVRGNHGSGKSTAVRSVLKQLGGGRSVFGVLGPRMPEAYHCRGPRRVLRVLGPYESSVTSGCDYITKLGSRRRVSSWSGSIN